MGIAEKVVTLKLTGAVAIDGVIARAGQLVEMVEGEAKDLLRRGKAVIHYVAEDVAKATEDVTPSTQVEASPATDAKGDDKKATK